MRVYCIPVARDAWTYFAVHPNPRSIWEAFEALRMRRGPGWQLLARLTDSLRREFEEMRRAPPGSFRSKVFIWCRKVLDRAHPEEDFFKTLSGWPTSVTVHYPAGVTEQEALARLDAVVRRNCATQWRWAIINALMLPLSLAAGVLPGPNVLFLYNAYRLHSRWNAYKGARVLATLHSSHHGPTTIANRPSASAAAEAMVPDPATVVIGAVPVSPAVEQPAPPGASAGDGSGGGDGPGLHLVPDAGLAACVGPLPRTQPLTDEEIARVAAALDLPAVAAVLKRARAAALGLPLA